MAIFVPKRRQKWNTFLSSFVASLFLVWSSIKRMFFCLSLCLFLSFSLFVCVFMRCVKFRLRIANCVEEDSYCRGGIVNTRFGFSCALLERRHSPKALWRFRASTSNIPSGRSRPYTITHVRNIDQTYAQQDIRVYEDDPLKPPKRQYQNPKAL